MALVAGGSVGSKRGNFYEYYLKKLLLKHGYYEDETKKLIQPNSYYFEYRVPPDKLTEIDLYFPSQQIGFWITSIGKINKLRCKQCSANKKYLEFDMISGQCCHCKSETLPNSSKLGYDRWLCIKCNKFCDPFELENIICSCNSTNFEQYTDRSASSSVHKAVYYRTAEYLDVKTSNKLNAICSQIIFNEKLEWRNWGNVIEKFYDSVLFTFDNNPHKFGSDKFDNIIWTFINDNLNHAYSSNMFSQTIIQDVSRNRNNYSSLWLNNKIVNRKKFWGDDYPAAFPIRYSIYTILSSLQKQSFVVPYEIGVIQYLKHDKLLVSNPIKKALKDCINKGYVKNNTVTRLGDQQLQIAINKYKEIIDYVPDYNGFIHPKDIWLQSKRKLIIQVLKKLLDFSINYGWYKFAMISNRDSDQLDSTPYINTQFEPLETLTRIYLQQYKSEGIISDFEGLDEHDVYEKTFLSDILPSGSKSSYKIGDDAKIVLPNNNIVYLQCKSNTSYKKWKNSGKIVTSGITYKDYKRMIGHNIFSSYEYKNSKLASKSNRYYVGILDGVWNSNKNDLFRMIKAMKCFGIDEIFFSDELDKSFRNYLQKIGTK
jgi:hypothetical protein